jgi:hypothetical protein
MDEDFSSYTEHLKEFKNVLIDEVSNARESTLIEVGQDNMKRKIEAKMEAELKIFSFLRERIVQASLLERGSANNLLQVLLNMRLQAVMSFNEVKIRKLKKNFSFDTHLMEIQEVLSTDAYQIFSRSILSYSSFVILSEVNEPVKNLLRMALALHERLDQEHKFLDLLEMEGPEEAKKEIPFYDYYMEKSKPSYAWAGFHKTTTLNELTPFEYNDLKGQEEEHLSLPTLLCVGDFPIEKRALALQSGSTADLAPASNQKSSAEKSHEADEWLSPSITGKSQKKKVAKSTKKKKGKGASPQKMTPQKNSHKRLSPSPQNKLKAEEKKEEERELTVTPKATIKSESSKKRPNPTVSLPVPLAVKKEGPRYFDFYAQTKKKGTLPNNPFLRLKKQSKITLEKLFNKDGLLAVTYDEFSMLWKQLGGNIRPAGGGGSHRALLYKGDVIGGTYQPHGSRAAYGKQTIAPLKKALRSIGYSDAEEIKK